MLTRSRLRSARPRRVVAGVVATGLVAAVTAAVSGAQAPATAANPPVRAAKAKPSATANPPVRHVFVINLENKGYDTTFGPDSPAVKANSLSPPNLKSASSSISKITTPRIRG